MHYAPTIFMDHTTGTKKRALIATFAIMGSRLLGLVREQVFAFFFGAGAVYDAFVVAFRIPNLLRDLAAEGALSQSFVTVFSQKIAANDQNTALKLTNKLSTFILIAVGAITILGIIFAPTLVKMIGWKLTDNFDLAVCLSRILFPYILFVSLAAILMGMLNAQKKFFIPFSASTFCNFISITLGLTCAYWMAPDYMTAVGHKILGHNVTLNFETTRIAQAITGMAVGTLLGGLGQYIFQLPSAIKQGLKPRLDFGFKEEAFVQVLKLTGPAIIAGAAVQVNVLINTGFATLIGTGSVSYLQYAFRFMQFPLGIFGVAIAAASAPVLAQMVTQKNQAHFTQTIQSSIQMSLFLCVPSTIGLVVLGPQIISLIYQHGRFTETDTIQTAYALAAYAIGITFYSLIKIYQPAYLAFNDAKTPMRISLFSIVINAALNAFFVFVMHWTHWALALGTAVVATTNLVFLAFYFQKKSPGVWTRDVFVTLIKIIVASFVMGAAIVLTLHGLKTVFSDGRLLDKCCLVFIPMAIALIAYFAAALLLGIKDAKAVVGKVLKRS